MLRARLTAAAALLGAVFALGTAPAGAQATAGSQGVVKVGQFSVGPCSEIGGAVDDELGVLVLLQQHDSSCTGSQTLTYTLSAYSIRTLRPLADKTIATSNHRALAVGRLPIDTKTGEVYVTWVDGSGTVEVYSLPALLHGSDTTLKPARSYTVPGTAQQLANGPDSAGVLSSPDAAGAGSDVALLPSGAYLDPDNGHLYLVLTNDPQAGGVNSITSTHGLGANDMYVLVADPRDGSQLGATRLTQCSYSADNYGSLLQPFLLASDPAVVVRKADGPHLVVGCETARGYALPLNAQQESALAYDVPLTSAGVPDSGRQSLYQVGRPGYAGGLADAADGRLFMSSFPAFGNSAGTVGAAGPAAVVYDGLHGGFVGAPTMGSVREDTYGGVGIDAAGHRFYAIGVDGVTVVNAASTPPGQGVLSAAYTCAVGSAIADPATRRIFVQPYKGCAYSGGTALQPHFDVLQDEYEQIGSQGAPDPDGYTNQLAEQPGVTSAQFAGHAEGTGARLQMLGGATGAIDGATFGTYITLTSNGVVPSPVNDYAPRELDLARVPSTDLGNFQAQASTDAATADDNTESTIESDTGQKSWVFPEVACSDSSGTEQKASQSYAAQTASSVTCKLGDFATAATNAGATGFALTVAGQNEPAAAFEVSHSIVTTNVYLDPKLGMVAQVTSTAVGIDFGVIRIGNVTVDNTCHAHGRTGTAACTFTRTISGVTANGVPVDGGSCTQIQSVNASSDSCGGLLAALNSVEPGYLTVVAPVPDSRRGFAGGSPGGYQAIAQRELYEHLQDAVVNYDDSIEVPGLELLYVQDSPTVPSRLDIQLANTESEAHYGITLLPPPCTGCDTSAPGPLTVALPPAPGLHAPAAAPPAAAGGLGRILQRVWQGLRLLLRSPAAAAAATALLLMLISPLLMGLRRRRLELLVQEVPS